MSAELVDSPVMRPRGRPNASSAAIYNLMKQRAARVPLLDIAHAVAATYGIDMAELRGESRKARFAHPRQVAMFLMRELTALSLPAIGSFFARDHTTVLHACRIVRARVRINWRDTGDQVEELRTLLTGCAGWSLYLWRPLRLEHAVLASYCRAVEEQGKRNARKPSPPPFPKFTSERDATARRLRQL